MGIVLVMAYRVSGVIIGGMILVLTEMVVVVLSVADSHKECNGVDYGCAMSQLACLKEGNMRGGIVRLAEAFFPKCLA